MSATNQLTSQQVEELFQTLSTRFEKNMNRHSQIHWADVLIKLMSNPNKCWSLYEMEKTGGEPDVVSYDVNKDHYTFFDCSAESPKGRRSLCYDRTGMESRKDFNPENNALDMASEMGIEILTEEQYCYLQSLGDFDLKTSSWLLTPKEVRKLGGALFGDFRYGRVFIYHNGAQSYYAARGFRGSLSI